MRIKRAVNIALLGLLRIYSPSLMRRVRISDIWETPRYLGGSNRIRYGLFRAKETIKKRIEKR